MHTFFGDLIVQKLALSVVNVVTSLGGSEAIARSPES